MFSGLDTVMNFFLRVSKRGRNQSAKVENLAKQMQEHARSKFGKYQGSVGPYPAWPTLSSSRRHYKMSKFGEDLPLLDSGSLRDSISYSVNKQTAMIGSSDPRMNIHEYGSGNTPPRPVLRPTAYEFEDTIKNTYIKVVEELLE